MAIEDILKKIGPSLLTAGVAGLGGVNPLLGLLAGPALGRSMENARERREVQNDLVRAQTMALRQPHEAAQQYADLLGRETINTELGPNMLTEGQQGPPRSRAGIEDPMSDPRVQGLLAQMGPAAYAANMSRQQGPRNPQSVEIELANLDAMLGAGYIDQDKWIEGRMNIIGANQTMNPMEEMNMRIAQLTELTKRDELEQKRIAREDKNASVAHGLNRAGHNMRTVVNSLDQLRGTALEPGLPIPDVREKGARWYSAIERLITGKESAMDSDIAALNTFNKEVAQMLLNMAANFAGNAGLGTITDSKLQLMKDGMANENVKPIAILGILQGAAADLLEEESKLRNRPGYEDWSMQEREWLQQMADGEVTWDSVKGDIERATRGGSLLQDDAGVTQVPPPPPGNWVRE